MKVSLIDYTGYGNISPARRAAELLVFTKSTRLQMQPSLMNEIKDWPSEKLQKELEYMANTIPSSWEFVDYTFLIEGVTRAFTHQLVRTRTASFAQQTMRVLDVSEGTGWDYLVGPSILNNPLALKIYKFIMKVINWGYKKLISMGISIEDARGILPTNILTNIVMKINMRNFVELVRKRSSSRTQGEYRDVLDAMKTIVLEVHPFIALFIDRDFDRAITDLETKIIRSNNLNKEERTYMVKLLDQLRAKQ